MNRKVEVRRILSLIGMAAAALLVARSVNAKPILVMPARMPHVVTVDERFQSYNVEMAEVIGGKFWKPYQSNTGLTRGSSALSSESGGIASQIGKNPNLFEARPPIDLANERLRKLAAALGPAYVRVSGTWANSVYFHDSDAPAPATPPNGFQGVLTRPEWRGVVDFAQAVNARIVTSFAVSQGVRNADGVWTPGQARRFLDYTRSIGGNIAAAEFFNEPDMPAAGDVPAGYDAADFARDLGIFRSFARGTVPKMLIVGPGSVGEGVPDVEIVPPSALLKTADLLAAFPRRVFDIFSYHYYGAVSLRCTPGGLTGTTAGAALSDQWLARADQANTFYESLRDRFEPGRPVWITEMADAACGGDPWASTFLDTFRYLDQHGRLARRGVKVIFHNTLASSEYGLIDQNTLTPRPNYWAALLWRKLMGPAVLDPGPSQRRLYLYAQCLPHRSGGVTLLAINSDRTRTVAIEVPNSSVRYTLTARKLEDTHVLLNGHELKLLPDDQLPSLTGEPITRGRVALAPLSVTFLAITEAGNRSCE
jgi:heparanase 1